MLLTEIDNNSRVSLYAQIYRQLKHEISRGHIRGGDRLPSLRGMAEDIGVSVTTVRIAYDQLITEGYIESRPQSGYYVLEGVSGINDTGSCTAAPGDSSLENKTYTDPIDYTDDEYAFDCDPASFDFIKWKKCITSVLNETPELLLNEADRQGELSLRDQISKYLYRSRAVKCSADQIVISAGTQQLVSHIARMLKLTGIGHVSVEDPGYMPVRNIFRDWGFAISDIAVRGDGISVEKLPVNLKSAVFVCPQNQFPTGAMMPVSRRRKILEWADENDSIIIEDDYNSELRYIGMPVPALQGLDQNGRVIYIGSFTSTLFPAVRISYMVLPERMLGVYEKIKSEYDQSCSKTEQLTLARFMQNGYYQSNLRKVKKLYSRKLDVTLKAIDEFGEGGKLMTAENTQSGISIVLKIKASSPDRKEVADEMTKSARRHGIKLQHIDQLDSGEYIYMAFYYSRIPIEIIRKRVEQIAADIKSAL